MEQDPGNRGGGDFQLATDGDFQVAIDKDHQSDPPFSHRRMPCSEQTLKSRLSTFIDKASFTDKSLLKVEDMHHEELFFVPAPSTRARRPFSRRR
jgi:hypothetical protein